VRVSEGPSDNTHANMRTDAAKQWVQLSSTHMHTCPIRREPSATAAGRPGEESKPHAIPFPSTVRSLYLSLCSPWLRATQHGARSTQTRAGRRWPLPSTSMLFSRAVCVRQFTIPLSYCYAHQDICTSDLNIAYFFIFM
jgi:hypothetical protein